MLKGVKTKKKIEYLFIEFLTYTINDNKLYDRWFKSN